jgi:hypothetical protein
MSKWIDTKTLLLIVLTSFAVVLTFIRERPIAPRELSSKKELQEELPIKKIAAVVDSTFTRMGVDTEKILHMKISVGEVKGVREEVRVRVPKSFEVLRAITTLTDSLHPFGVSLVSTENLKEKTSSIHLLHDKKVFESIVISKEKQQKGTTPSVSTRQKGTPRRARR